MSVASLFVPDPVRYEGVRPINVWLPRLNYLLMAVFIAPLVPAVASAQFPAQIQSGERIRAWVSEPYAQQDGPRRRQLLRGTVAAVDGDTLRLAVPGTVGTLVIPRAFIRRLDVSQGPPSRLASAVERAFGLAIVGAIGTALENDPYGSKWPNYRRDWRAAGEGAKWGAAIGAVIGFVLPTERWRRVALR